MSRLGFYCWFDPKPNATLNRDNLPVQVLPGKVVVPEPISRGLIEFPLGHNRQQNTHITQKTLRRRIFPSPSTGPHETRGSSIGLFFAILNLSLYSGDRAPEK